MCSSNQDILFRSGDRFYLHFFAIVQRPFKLALLLRTIPGASPSGHFPDGPICSCRSLKHKRACI